MNHGVHSKAKGKIGGIVYQQYEGLQVAKEYQPNVMNPQTPAQMGARAKFKLASQVLALWKEILLKSTLESIYTRFRRAQVFKTILSYVAQAGETLEVRILKVLGELNLSNSAAYTGIIVSENQGNHGMTFDYDPSDGNTRAYEYKAVAYDAAGSVLGSYVENGNISSQAFMPFNLPLLPAGVTPDHYEVLVIAQTGITDEGRASVTRFVEEGSKYTNGISRSVATGDIVTSPIVRDYWTVA